MKFVGSVEFEFECQTWEEAKEWMNKLQIAGATRLDRRTFFEMTTSYDELVTECRRRLKEPNSLVDTIKYFRAKSGCGLVEANDFVRGLRESG